MKKFDSVVIGELNADIILKGIPELVELGKEKIATDMLLTMGSASAIFASNLSKLGLQVGFIGKIGNDHFGEVVLSGLEKANVNLEGIIRDNKSSTGITIAMTFPSDYAMVTYMGAMESFNVSDINYEYLSEARHIHFASYYLQPGMRSGCKEMFMKAKEFGLITSFDPGWDPSERWEDDILEVLPYVDYFLPNENEAILISKKRSVEEALEYLSIHGNNIIIKKGRDGISAHINRNKYDKKVYKIVPIDTSGAGDSFNAGFIYGLLNEKSIEECLDYGMASGALACTKMGGSDSAPNINELLEFIKIHSAANL